VRRFQNFIEYLEQGCKDDQILIDDYDECFHPTSEFYLLAHAVHEVVQTGLQHRPSDLPLEHSTHLGLLKNLIQKVPQDCRIKMISNAVNKNILEEFDTLKATTPGDGIELMPLRTQRTASNNQTSSNN
jgi:hypothetical protein